MSKVVRPAFSPFTEGLTPADDLELVDLHLRDYLEDARHQFASNPCLTRLFERVGEFVLQGGKRLRPRLCLASHRIISGRNEAPPKPVWLTAASLEVFHAFMLVHDDIIDRSLTRRERPSLPEQFRLESDAPNSTGAIKRAADLSLLSGDLLCALAVRLVAGSGLEDATLGRVTRLLADMLVETGLGEVLDVVSEERPLSQMEEEPLVETYLRKTARYTVSGPLVLGATIAGASAKVCQALDRFGDLLGFGFQIQNDLDSLDEDIRQGDHVDLDGGKRTFVLWRAYRMSSPARRLEISEALQDAPSLDRRRKLIELIEESGAIRFCRAHLARLQREAVSVLKESPLTLSQRRAYIQLVEHFRLKPRTLPSRESSTANEVLPLHLSPSELTSQTNHIS